MSEIKELTKLINKWVRERGWEKFQTPKDLAISLSLEASEVLELFQWKNDKEVKKYVSESRAELAEEIADVGIYLLKLADKTGVNLQVEIEKKLAKASKKHPIGKIKPSHG